MQSVWRASYTLYSTQMAYLSSFVFSKNSAVYPADQRDLRLYKATERSPQLAKWRLNNASFHAAEWSSVSRKLSTNKPLLEARERKASRPWTNGYFNVRKDGQSFHRGCTTKTRGATGFRARMILWRLALLSVIALLLCYRAQC